MAAARAPPTIDSLARAGIRFTHFYPEAMATIPARRSIMSGRRVFPFRDWRSWPGLGSTPGWAPIDAVDATFTSVLRRAGYWTGYVTDNPFLGFSAPYERFRRSFTDFMRVGGQMGATRPLSGVSQRELEHWLIPELRQPHTRARIRRFLAASESYWLDESRSFAARVFTAATGALETGRPPAPIRADRRHLRATRAVDTAPPIHRPIRRPRPPRPRAMRWTLRASE